MRRQPGAVVLIILLLVGALAGGIVGEFLGNYWPVLGNYNNLGFSPTTVDLGALQLTAGFMMRFNLVSIAGLLVAFFVYRRL